MNNKYKPPFVGVAYYPEDWDESCLEYDISMMKKAGFNVARVAEFAWTKMEKTEGVFTFDWLHRVVDALGEAGIATILCTPSATPPRWLSVKHPDVFAESENGAVQNHGGRRHCCSNNPNYIKYSLRIAEEMAKEFADDENVIGWQIDNEIYTWGTGCFCETCQKKFIDRLKNKFGDIEELNARWDLGAWSQEYNSFDDIQAPRNAGINPHHRTEWATFQQESNIEFVTLQAEVLKKYVKVPVGTDMMPFGGLSYPDMNRKLDVVQFNHYNTEENLWEICFWFDFIRTIIDRPFWNTETSTCWNGGTSIDQTIKKDGFCYVNSWLPLALGGEANLYWLWRTHWGGHELMHGSVLATDGRPMHIFDEVKKVSESFNKAADFINNTKVETNVAMHYTALSHNIRLYQNVVNGPVYVNILKENFYRALSDSSIRPDVIESETDLDKYKVLFTNLCMSLEDRGMAEKIRKWVENGGIWIVGPMTDIRNADAAKYPTKPYGMLEEMLGIYQDFEIPDRQNEIKCELADGRVFEGTDWLELFEPDEDTLATVKSAPHSALIGKGVYTKKKVGKGTVYFLGTIPTYETVKNIIIPEVMALAGIETAESNDLIIADRKGDGIEGKIIVDISGKGGSYTLPYPAFDILSEKELDGKIEIKPYDVLVLKKI